MKTHTIIPIFLPELACPNRCIYCNQRNISSVQTLPTDEEIISTIERNLQTSTKSKTCEIAFFGGSFTGLPIDTQKKYLELAQPYLENSKIDYLRISTRPDYITEEILIQLKKYNVEIIELGAQSLDDETLRLCGRGHTCKDVEIASKLINDYGFTLGLQMMLGLPGDNAEKAFSTAKKIVNLGAKATRIYPTLIIDNTELAEMYKNGSYTPLNVDEAVAQCVPIYKLFLENNITIYKCGLHPSDFLYNGKLLAGPWHQCFRQLVQSEIFKEKIEIALKNNPNCNIVEVCQADFNAALGHKRSNQDYFSKKISNFKININNKLKRGEINALHN